MVSKRQRPQVEIVGGSDTRHGQQGVPYRLKFHTPRGTFHEDEENISKCRSCGPKGADREEEGANGVGHLVLGLEVDEDRGSQDPEALKEIAQHMHKGSPDTGVSQGQWVPVPLLQWCILCTPRSVAVGGSSLVQHKGHYHVGTDSNAGSQQHGARLNVVVTVKQAEEGQVQEDAGDYPEGDHRGQSSQSL